MPTYTPGIDTPLTAAEARTAVTVQRSDCGHYTLARTWSESPEPWETRQPTECGGEAVFHYWVCERQSQTGVYLPIYAAGTSFEDAEDVFGIYSPPESGIDFLVAAPRQAVGVR